MVLHISLVMVRLFSLSLVLVVAEKEAVEVQEIMLKLPLQIQQAGCQKRLVMVMYVTYH